MSVRIGKVLYNVTQGLHDSEKELARKNIGAAAESDLSTLAESVAEFTDTKVTQTKDDSGTDEYPLLMAGATNPDGDATTARYDSDVKLNPSTNTISANISGNAATATIASATSSGAIQDGDDLNSYNTANRTYLCNADNASTVTNKPSDASGAFELEVIRGTGSSCVQIYYSRDDVNFNYIRKYTGLDTWTSWVKLVDSSDVNYTAGEAINISSENVISNGSPVKFSSVIGNIDLSPCSTNVVAQRNRNSLTYTEMSFVNQYNNTGSFVLIPLDLGEGYIYIADNYISVKTIDSPSVVSGSATDVSWTNTIYQTPVKLDWNFTLDAGKLLDINVNACVYQNSQTSTPLYRMELVDASNNVKTYFSWVPREMDAAETDPDRSTLNGRLVWKNSTSASVTLSLRISDKEQAPTGTTELESIRIDGFVR